MVQQSHQATNNYAYDAANRLVGVDGVTYAWDATPYASLAGRTAA